MRVTKRQLRRIIRERHQRPYELRMLRSFIRQTMNQSDLLLGERTVIYEGLGVDLKGPLRDILKVAIGTGAVIGTGGMGGDTISDLIFAVDSSQNVIDGLEGAISGASEMEDIVNAARETNIRSGPEAIYDSILEITQKLSADGAEASIDNVKAEVDALIEGIASAVGDWIATALPDDAGLGGIAMRETIESIIGSASDNIYEQIKSGFNRLPKLAQDFIKNPEAMREFFNRLADDIVEILKSEEAAATAPPLEDAPPPGGLASPEGAATPKPEEESEDEKGLFTKAAGAVAGAAIAPVGGAVVKTVASSPMVQAALPLLINYLDGDFRGLIDFASDIPNMLVTVLFGAVAFLQIVITEEYKEEASPEATTTPEAPSMDRMAAFLAGVDEGVTENRLRKIIREVIWLQEKEQKAAMVNIYTRRKYENQHARSCNLK